jgi:uncharacterized repeat protein (TIGR01451 family)
MTCDFTITVNDIDPPSITCPSSIDQTVLGPTSVDFTVPASVDNCPGSTTTCDPVSGSTFPLGSTTDTCTTTDTAGNIATCSFLVTLETPADLSVTKTDTPDPVMAGDNVTYTIVLTNNGPNDAQNVALTDQIPANTTFVSIIATPPGWSISSPPVGGTGTITASKATMTNGEVATFTLVVNVDSDAPDDILLTNTATAVSDTGDLDTSNNSSTATTSTGLPQITIDDVTVTEGDSGTVDACFAVSLSKASVDIVTVDFETADNTAQEPDDYLSDAGSLTFPVGETVQTLCVMVNSDTLEESDEDFFVDLSNPDNALIGDGQGIGTIVDDDGQTPLPGSGELQGAGCLLVKTANQDHSTGRMPLIFLSLLFLPLGILAIRKQKSLDCDQ